MFKRIALAALLLVTTALIAHVWADEGCENCGEAWQDATDAQTGAGQDKGWAEVMREVAVDLREDIEYCYDNHGGATSEGDYQSEMTDGDDCINRGDFQKGLGTVEFGHGDTSMAAGNMICPTNCTMAASSYATAETHFNTASGHYNNAYDEYLQAVWAYDAASQFLVGEEYQYGCGCTFTW